MREIEFRGKRIDNGEWIYGCCGYGFTQTVEYIMPDMFFATRNFGEIDKQGNPKIENEIAIGGYFAVDQKTVGQFTGLLDKNGKKIFEGDVVNIKEAERKYVVKFHNGCFKLFHADPKLNGMLWGNVERVFELLWNFEIIGNVHDNPELLK